MVFGSFKTPMLHRGVVPRGPPSWLPDSDPSDCFLWNSFLKRPSPAITSAGNPTTLQGE